MKRFVKNESKRIEEEKEKERRRIDGERRDKYLESLRNNKHFQKYVLEEIIQKSIDDLTDTRVIKNAYIKSGGSLSNKEELANIVIQSIQASITVEKIFGKLKN